MATLIQVAFAIRPIITDLLSRYSGPISRGIPDSSVLGTHHPRICFREPPYHLHYLASHDRPFIALCSLAC